MNCSGLLGCAELLMYRFRAHNKAYVKHVSYFFFRNVRKTRALILIQALRAAIKATWQDSGQFAANWHISIGRSNPKEGPDFSRGTPPIGKKGDAKSERGWTAEREVYHFRMGKESINSNNAEMTRLFNDLAKGKGRMPSLSIYNPLYNKGVSSGHCTSKPY